MIITIIKAINIFNFISSSLKIEHDEHLSFFVFFVTDFSTLSTFERGFITGSEDLSIVNDRFLIIKF